MNQIYLLKEKISINKLIYLWKKKKKKTKDLKNI